MLTKKKEKKKSWGENPVASKIDFFFILKINTVLFELGEENYIYRSKKYTEIWRRDRWQEKGE